LGPLTLHTEIEQWPLKAPFRITGYTWREIDVLLVSLRREGLIGSGEAAGVYYKEVLMVNGLIGARYQRGARDLARSRGSGRIWRGWSLIETPYRCARCGRKRASVAGR